jgi:peptide/nickel transport system permease protein
VQNLDRVLEAPGGAYLLGSDHLGRSVFARLSHAVRLSLSLSIVAVFAAAIPGTALGLLAAWRGGWVETALGLISDAVLALPGLLLVVLLTALAPGALWPFYLGLSLAFWVEYFRVVRATVRPVLASPAVEASRLLGFGPLYVVRRHVVPEILPIVLTLMTFGAATAVVSLATMGFLGVGLRPPTPELGLMMVELFPHARLAPWAIAAPVGALALATLGFTLCAGEGRRP